MSLERRQIFAHLTISANIGDFARLGEINEFIHDVADVIVDSEAETVTVLKKESIPIKKEDVVKIFGVDGINVAQEAAKSAAEVVQLKEQLKEANDKVMSLEAALTDSKERAARAVSALQGISIPAK